MALGLQCLASVVALLLLHSQVITCYNHGHKAYIRKRIAPESCDPDARYSRIDGHCNNLDNTAWGSPNQLMTRLAPGSPSSPRLTGADGQALPSARQVSLTYHTPKDDSGDVTLMHMQFGQFLDHDITATPSAQVAAPCACDNTDTNCLPITLDGDEFFTQRQCLPFTRSAQVDNPTTGTSENVNVITAYIDASNVYGSSDEELANLRNAGTLKTSTVQGKGVDYLPEGAATSCNAQAEGEYCFLAGDGRVNVQPGLTAMHTIFMREHNRIADRLKKINNNWSGDQIFHETRKILIGIMQNIVYNEYLPPLVGPDHVRDFSLSTSTYTYDSSVSANMINSFSTAAFRFGHSQIPEVFKMAAGQTPLEFEDIFFRPIHVIESERNIWKTSYVTSAPRVDGHFSHSITRHLFQQDTAQSGQDLVSRNIQRGRDHGLPSYNQFREACGLSKKETLQDVFPDVKTGSHVYRSVDDIDLFTGAMAEDSVAGGLVGPTFACIISEQFRRLKMGDRFYFENNSGPGALTQEQIGEIRKMTLAKVICRNAPKNKNLQADIFLPADTTRNPIKKCPEIPDIDLTLWAQS